MIEKKTQKCLEALGLRIGIDPDSIEMTVLKVMFSIQEHPGDPLSFRDIYGVLIDDEISRDYSESYVHRILKSLVSQKLIRIQQQKAYRKKYIVDVNTLLDALEISKHQQLRELKIQQKELDTRIKELEGIDCGTVAQNLVENLSGHEILPSSQFIQGFDELHRVTNYRIYDSANKDDIIRVSVKWIKPIMKNYLQRTSRVLLVAERGVEVRYLVTADILRLNKVVSQATSEDFLEKMMAQFVKLRKKGAKLDVRINASNDEIYQFVGLNTSDLAILFNASPVTAAWITRSFNPDLIDNATETFDTVWAESKSILDLRPEDIEAFGASADALFLKTARRVTDQEL